MLLQILSSKSPVFFDDNAVCITHMTVYVLSPFVCLPFSVPTDLPRERETLLLLLLLRLPFRSGSHPLCLHFLPSFLFLSSLFPVPLDCDIRKTPPDVSDGHRALTSA